MSSFVSVKFTPAGRTVSFLLPDLMLDTESDGAVIQHSPRPGEQVVVDTADGPAIGTVTRVNSSSKSFARLPVVVRRASRDDIVQRLKHKQRRKKPIGWRSSPSAARAADEADQGRVSSTDAAHLLLHVESRVDRLVRDLAAHFRMRIEMRQFGCATRQCSAATGRGRPLCCTRG
jgi:hypothetical protein